MTGWGFPRTMTGGKIQLTIAKKDPINYILENDNTIFTNCCRDPVIFKRFKKIMSGKRIIEGMKEALAISKGELAPTAYKIHIPENVDVKAIREKMGLSQSSFANRFGLSVYALRNWEQGTHTPDPTARAYLKVIEKVPDIVAKVLVV